MSVQLLEAHELRAKPQREIDRIDREFESRLIHNAQVAYGQGYDDGAAAAHPLVSFSVGALAGVIATLAWPALARWVAGFFS